MMFDEKKERRFYAKVVIGSPVFEVVYYRNDMKPEFFFKWKWYFDYRAALAKVLHPRLEIRYSTGHYEYELPEDVYRGKIRNKYIAAKRSVTISRRNVERMVDNYNDLFPVEDHPEYPKVMERLQHYEDNLKKYEVLWEEVKQIKT